MPVMPVATGRIFTFVAMIATPEKGSKAARRIKWLWTFIGATLPISAILLAAWGYHIGSTQPGAIPLRADDLILKSIRIFVLPPLPEPPGWQLVAARLLAAATVFRAALAIYLRLFRDGWLRFASASGEAISSYAG